MTGRDEPSSADAAQHARETDIKRLSIQESEESHMQSGRTNLLEQLDELRTGIKALLDDFDKANESSGILQEVTKERDELKAQMTQITQKLQRVSELYREASAEKDKLREKVDVSELLSIYIMLIETVFGGKPHARVLYTLHNTKKAITRKNLESSSGIMSTAIIKAIHDLRNANLVSYDEETQEVKLIKDIL
jgi:hypothetical protein